MKFRLSSPHIQIILLGNVFAALSPFTSCKETLPDYQPPANVFEGTVAFNYALTLTENRLHILPQLKNVFDETFQDTASLLGTVKIQSVRDPSVTKSFAVTYANLLSTASIDQQTKIMTVDPQQVIRFDFAWDFVDDSTRDMRTQFFEYMPDTTCELTQYAISRCLAFTESFVVTGNIQLFKQTGPIYFSNEYDLCFVSRYIGGRWCPIVITDQPCHRPPEPLRCEPTDFSPVQ